MLKRSLLGIAFVATLGSVALPAGAAIIVRIAPPAPRVEVVPPPRAGFVWVPGYWNWNGRRHVWVAGAWVRERPGYVYRQPRWVERGGHWEFEGGTWSRRDRDGDGVPNRFDARPDNPHRS